MALLCFTSFLNNSVAIDALKEFLKVTDSDEILERLESNGVWPLMETEDTCPHAMLHLARYGNNIHMHNYCKGSHEMISRQPLGCYQAATQMKSARQWSVSALV